MNRNRQASKYAKANLGHAVTSKDVVARAQYGRPSRYRVLNKTGWDDGTGDGFVSVMATVDTKKVKGGYKALSAGANKVAVDTGSFDD